LEGTYVFCSIKGERSIQALKKQLDPLGTFREQEGLSLLITKEEADKHKLKYHGTFACITLDVHSSLDAVGLTAVAASRLAMYGISANVVAACYHDHVFVQSHHAPAAVGILGALGGHAGAGSAFIEKSISQEPKRVAGVKRKKDPTKPKRSMTAYTCFIKCKRPEISSKYAKTFEDNKLIMKELSTAWAGMDEAQRKPYHDMASKDKIRYLKQKEAWDQGDTGDVADQSMCKKRARRSRVQA